MEEERFQAAKKTLSSTNEYTSVYFLYQEGLELPDSLDTDADFIALFEALRIIERCLDYSLNNLFDRHKFAGRIDEQGFMKPPSMMPRKAAAITAGAPAKRPLPASNAFSAAASEARKKQVMAAANLNLMRSAVSVAAAPPVPPPDDTLESVSVAGALLRQMTPRKRRRRAVQPPITTGAVSMSASALTTGNPSTSHVPSAYLMNASGSTARGNTTSNESDIGGGKREPELLGTIDPPGKPVVRTFGMRAAALGARTPGTRAQTQTQSERGDDIAATETTGEAAINDFSVAGALLSTAAASSRASRNGTPNASEDYGLDATLFSARPEPPRLVPQSLSLAIHQSEVDAAAAVAAAAAVERPPRPQNTLNAGSDDEEEETHELASDDMAMAIGGDRITDSVLDIRRRNADDYSAQMHELRNRKMMRAGPRASIGDSCDGGARGAARGAAAPLGPPLGLDTGVPTGAGDLRTGAEAGSLEGLPPPSPLVSRDDMKRAMFLEVQCTRDLFTVLDAYRMENSSELLRGRIYFCGTERRTKNLAPFDLIFLLMCKCRCIVAIWDSLHEPGVYTIKSSDLPFTLQTRTCCSQEPVLEYSMNDVVCAIRLLSDRWRSLSYSSDLEQYIDLLLLRVSMLIAYGGDGETHNVGKYTRTIKGDLEADAEKDLLCAANQDFVSDMAVYLYAYRKRICIRSMFINISLYDMDAMFNHEYSHRLLARVGYDTSKFRLGSNGEDDHALDLVGGAVAGTINYEGGMEESLGLATAAIGALSSPVLQLEGAHELHTPQQQQAGGMGGLQPPQQLQNLSDVDMAMAMERDAVENPRQSDDGGGQGHLDFGSDPAPSDEDATEHRIERHQEVPQTKAKAYRYSMARSQSCNNGTSLAEVVNSAVEKASTVIAEAMANGGVVNPVFVDDAVAGDQTQQQQLSAVSNKKTYDSARQATGATGTAASTLAAGNGKYMHESEQKLLKSVRRAYNGPAIESMDQLRIALFINDEMFKFFTNSDISFHLFTWLQGRSEGISVYGEDTVRVYRKMCLNYCIMMGEDIMRSRKPSGQGGTIEAVLKDQRGVMLFNKMQERLGKDPNKIFPDAFSVFDGAVPGFEAECIKRIVSSRSPGAYEDEERRDKYARAPLRAPDEVKPKSRVYGHLPAYLDNPNSLYQRTRFDVFQDLLVVLIMDGFFENYFSTSFESKYVVYERELEEKYDSYTRMDFPMIIQTFNGFNLFYRGAVFEIGNMACTLYVWMRIIDHFHGRQASGKDISPMYMDIFGTEKYYRGKCAISIAQIIKEETRGAYEDTSVRAKAAEESGEGAHEDKSKAEAAVEGESSGCGNIQLVF